MIPQTISTQPPPVVPDGCIALAELEYLLNTGRIDYVVLAGTPVVSVEGIRDYLQRHAGPEHSPRSELQPLLVDINCVGSAASAPRTLIQGGDHERPAAQPIRQAAHPCRGCRTDPPARSYPALVPTLR